MSEGSLAHAVGEQSIVPDAHEVRRQDVEDEAASELETGQGEHVGAVAVGAVPPAETDVGAVVVKDAGVGDGDLACVARDIAYDLLGAGQGRLGVDDPTLTSGALEKLFAEGPRQAEAIVGVRRFELVQELSAEDPA